MIELLSDLLTYLVLITVLIILLEDIVYPKTLLEYKKWVMHKAKSFLANSFDMLLVISWLFFLLLLMGIVFRDKGFFDENYFFIYFFNNLNLLNFLSFIRYDYYFRVVFSSIQLVLIFITVLTYVPYYLRFDSQNSTNSKLANRVVIIIYILTLTFLLRDLIFQNYVNFTTLNLYLGVSLLIIISKKDDTNKNSKDLSILIISWRSLKDPKSGGAEIATMEHARRWVKKHNASVIWLSPPYSNSSKGHTIEGIKFEYTGVPLGDTVLKLMITFPLFYLSVCWRYLSYYRKKVDLVIDQVHGLPYMTPIYVRKPKLVYIHEIAGPNIWDKMFPFPINRIGYLVEKIIFRYYQNEKFICVSRSTKNDLINIGLKAKNISIITNGVNIPVSTKPGKKERELTLIFLNRVVRMKGIERALRVFSLIKEKEPKAQFWVVGRVDKPFKKKLLLLCKNLDIKSSVKFFGYVSDSDKISLLSSSHLLLNTSHKEGWGLVNIEANSQGTPVIGFAVSGNVDSIVPKVSGYLIKDGDLHGMCDKVLESYEDSTLREASIKYASNFSWDDSSDKFFKHIVKLVNEQK